MSLQAVQRIYRFLPISPVPVRIKNRLLTHQQQSHFFVPQQQQLQFLEESRNFAYCYRCHHRSHIPCKLKKKETKFSSHINFFLTTLLFSLPHYTHLNIHHCFRAGRSRPQTRVDRKLQNTNMVSNTVLQ